jgi:hypothetical protein
MSGRRVGAFRVWDGMWLAGWVAASSLWCVTASQRLGATFDEPFYVHAGLEAWRTGSHRALLKKGTMPLPADVQTLPLYVRERWHGERFDTPTRFAESLAWARAMTLPFWWLLLWYGMRAGRDIAGAWGGRLVVALLACEPSLLAHASLATADVAVATGVLMLAYHFRVGRSATWPRRVGIPVLCYAAALLAKASALLIGPLCLLVIELERVWRQPLRAGAGASDPRACLRAVAAALKPFWSDCVWIVAGGLALAFVFCGSDWAVEPSFVAWAGGLSSTGFGHLMIWLADHLRIFSNAGEALVKQVRHNVRGHGAYLLGRSAPRAFWYYFPVALSIKLSEPVLVGPLLLAAVRPRALANWASLTAAVLIVFSLGFRVQLGVRMVLPAVVLLIIGLAAAAVQAAQSCTRPWRNVMSAAAAAAVVWNASMAARLWPHGLSYINYFWDRRADGYVLVSDSNYDWGQGLQELRRWAVAHQVAVLPVWYFGTDPAIHQLPLRELPLHVLPITAPADVVPLARGRLVAVSTTNLYGAANIDVQAHQHAAAFFRAHHPVARTTTFLIYDFRDG